jgi:hypothetical protein
MPLANAVDTSGQCIADIINTAGIGGSIIAGVAGNVVSIASSIGRG